VNQWLIAIFFGCSNILLSFFMCWQKVAPFFNHLSLDPHSSEIGGNAVRAPNKQRLPVVLSVDEVKRQLLRSRKRSEKGV
jgi:hypothetical protein